MFLLDINRVSPLQLFPMTENPFAPPAPMERFVFGDLDTGREMVHFTPEGVGADKLRFSRDNQLLLIFGREQTWTLRVPSLRTIDEELSKKHSTEKTS